MRFAWLLLLYLKNSLKSNSFVNKETFWGTVGRDVEEEAFVRFFFPSVHT